MTASSTSPSASGAASASRPRAPLYVVRLDAAARRVVVGPREALERAAHGAARRELAGRRRARRCARAGRREVFVKVRSTRPPQAGWLGAAASGVEVELAGSRGRRRAGSGLRVLRCASTARRACSAAASSRADGERRSAARCRRGRRDGARGGARLRSAARLRLFSYRIPRRGGGRRAAAEAVELRGDMGADLDQATIAKAYARWAPVYDLVFGAVFERGRNGGDRGGRAHRRAHPRSRRRHRHLAARLCAHQPPGRRRHFRADAAQGARARRRASASPMSTASP